VEIPNEDLTADDVVDELAVPVMLAAGYSRVAIEEIFYGCDVSDEMPD
jgi:hypothetical protein